MDLYLVRHGQTESNKERRYIGWSESPLTEEGIRQAEKAGFFLGRHNIGGLYSSNLKRAVHTARVVGSMTGLKPVVTPLLREINFGQWEGLTYDQIESRWGGEIRLWFDDPFNRSTPDGETLARVCARMKSFLDRVTAQVPPGSRIAAVSHGGSIRALLYHVLNVNAASFWDIKIDNASISLIRREGDGFKVVYYNRTDYLGAGDYREELIDGN